MKKSETNFKGNEILNLEFDKGTNPQLKNEINKLINLFLDEFMLEEYKGGQHI